MERDMLTGYGEDAPADDAEWADLVAADVAAEKP
jgi:hypothetical protein